jgi:hypothetical protein
MFHPVERWLRFYREMSAVYPPKWYWPIVRIFGGPGRSETDGCYMTRVILGPETRWGQLYLHVFHREDLDRDPHDHPFAFWTLPLNQGYIEDVYDPVKECFTAVRAPHFRWSFRKAEHIHRVIGCDHGWPLVTLVWRKPSSRKWGFWCHTPDQEPLDTTRTWMPWASYLIRGDNVNVPGADAICPGVKSEYRHDARP